jgi:NADPH:quinone reductase-like Zn-dependent oxidoreductase
MKAAVIDRLGAVPRPAELPDPVAAKNGQVVIKVEAAALNPVDLIIAGGLHPAGQPKFPYVPAIEAVGTIVAGWPGHAG